jgi:ERF superfamily
MKLIAAALLTAKRNFTPALKEKTNPAFRSKYADLGACFDAVDTPCLDAGIILYQETSEDSTGVTVETVFLHESGETLRCGKLHVPASKQDPQGYGSALTYARRYSLLTACGIAPEDDDGNAASKKYEPIQPVFISKAQLEKLQSLASEIPIDLQKFCEAVQIASLKDIHAADFDKAVAMMEKKRKPASV